MRSCCCNAKQGFAASVAGVPTPLNTLEEQHRQQQQLSCFVPTPLPPSPAVALCLVDASVQAGTLAQLAAVASQTFPAVTHSTPAQTEHIQTVAIECQTAAAAPVVADRNEAEVQTDNNTNNNNRRLVVEAEVQTDGPVQLVPSCLQMAAQTDEEPSASPTNCCVEGEVPVTQDWTAGRAPASCTDALVQTEAQPPSESDSEIAQLRLQVEDLKQRHVKQASSSAKREQQLRLDASVAAAEGCAEERRENQHQTEVLAQQYAQVEILEACLKRAKEQIGAQESALKGLEQLNAKCSQEQALNIRQKRLLEDAKKQLEQQTLELTQLRSTSRAAATEEPSKEELLKLLGFAEEDTRALRAELRDLKTKPQAPGRPTQAVPPPHSQERSSSQPPPSSALLRRALAKEGSLLPSVQHSRTNSLPPVCAVPSSLEAPSPTPWGPVPGSVGRALKARITTLADIGRG
ncbi:unnamed protein product [Polarella glacialis]|uniref:Uncharacterized protein n=1 Tax=Polarella glacialis TaxID=89957 RepID=A0A813GQ54_POLGL|nr:unnamed protein product [Polarella glacialis]